MTPITAPAMHIHDERVLPEGWRWAKLGNVCELNPPRPSISRGDSASTSFIPMESVDDTSGSVKEVRERPYGEVKKGYTYFAEGDVLFAKITPCMQNGKHTIASGLIDGFGFGTTEFHVLRPGNNIIAEWVWFFLRRPILLLDATRHFTGAVGQRRVPEDYLASLDIPLPPLPEQHRLAGVIRHHLAAIAKARAANQGLHQATNTLPFAWLREAFESPEAANWPTKRLGDVLVPYKETIHPGDRDTGTATFVGLEHLESNTGRRIGSLLIDLARLTGRKPTFRRGQIVYGYLRPYLNKVWIAEFDGCSSVDQFAYDVKHEIADVRFLAWFMRSPTFLRRAEVVTTTGQLPRIGTEQIAAVQVGLPALERQRLIAEQMDHRFAIRQNVGELLRTQLDAIETLPAAIVRRAFSGEL